MFPPAHHDGNHLFCVNSTRFEQQKCWWRGMAAEVASGTRISGGISREIDSKLMFPWSDCRIFLIFLLGVMCRTRPVPNRANPKN